jgi:hypothetical protein
MGHRRAVAGRFAALIVWCTCATPIKAQRPVRIDSTSMPGMQMTVPMVADPLGVSMERMGSGTTWVPDAVSIPSRMFAAGSWSMMLHGFVFGEYDSQSGPRGATQFGSTNWAMLMAMHELAGGRVQLRSELSLDAATVTARGYPQLLQTGEAYDGVLVHDRQHPHDLFMELGAMYDRAITSNLGFTLYAAPSGEPALGPVAFMHRPSAMDNPTVPLGHHWQDPTHISFGVLTAGLFTRQVRIEASMFNGREPDQDRWNFDPIRLDSYSARISYNPDSHWAMNASYGFLKSPDALTPDVSMHRVTASAMYGRKLGDDGQIATTFLWGANAASNTPGLSHSALIESEAILDSKNTVFGRVEYVQKDAEELAIDLTPLALLTTSPVYDVGALSLGYIREIFATHATTLGLGAMGTLNFVPAALEQTYGSRTPTGLFVFVRLRARAEQMH